MKKARVLIIDDERGVLEWLRIALEEYYDVDTLQNPVEITKFLDKKYYDCIVCDIRMPEKDGFYVLEKVKNKYPDVPFIFITAYGTLELAIEAFRKGANDFILKPFKENELIFRIEKALEKKIPVKKVSLEDTFVGESSEIKEIKSLIYKAAQHDSTVLISGESGVGKEVVARLIHNLSRRKKEPFITINCAAIPETLLESELFGYKKGAFTGAYETKKGLLSAAQNGTLFLDEIADMPFALQSKLLRVIETHSFIPLGSVREEKVNVRIISATNKDLKKFVQEGKFREDLYYRLNVFPIYIPPLRERKDDIETLVEHFLKLYSKKMAKELRITREALNVLKNYRWPGNVRELENLLERLAILSEDGLIHENIIPEEIKMESESEDLKRMEYEFLKKVIKECEGDIKKAAEKLGVHPSTLYRKIKKYRKDEQVQ